jgi:hypothetical protein
MDPTTTTMETGMIMIIMASIMIVTAGTTKDTMTITTAITTDLMIIITGIMEAHLDPILVLGPVLRVPLLVLLMTTTGITKALLITMGTTIALLLDLPVLGVLLAPLPVLLCLMIITDITMAHMVLLLDLPEFLSSSRFAEATVTVTVTVTVLIVTAVTRFRIPKTDGST